MKKILITAVCATLALAACSDKKEENQPTASVAAADICAPDDLGEKIQAQAMVSFETIRQFWMGNPNMFDENKLLSIFKELNWEVRDVQAVRDVCQAQVHITIAADVMQLATINAPILMQAPPKDLIAGETQGSNMRFDGQTLTLPLNYQINQGNLVLQDENLRGAMRMMSAALSPYGVRDSLPYRGKTVSRQEYLALLKAPKQPEMQIASMPGNLSAINEVSPITDAVPTQPTSSEFAASTPEIMQPEKPQNRIQSSELEAARTANAQADQSIKSAWRKISPEIQQTLVDEQRNWESKKRQNCRSVGAKGRSAEEIQYLQMQCDTRLTRERVQYLNGFSIDH